MKGNTVGIFVCVKTGEVYSKFTQTLCKIPYSTPRAVRLMCRKSLFIRANTSLCILTAKRRWCP